MAVYETWADWEVGHLLVELRTGRFTGEQWRVVTVGESAEPVVSMGGVRIVPDVVLAEVEPEGGDLLVLAGSAQWDEGGHAAFAELARRFLHAGVPVAAICGATSGLARAGILDDRRHTSAAREYLEFSGYKGGDKYVDERAVVDGDLITAGPDSPVQFARAVLQRLGLASEAKLDAYEGVFHRADPAAYPVLVG
ncbi:putative intracellular protease/amidase [Kribbella antiqua]|uniref:Putative intracellular protease/amidase n=1 Tax=Kribbella antiqua TaxID=2512217 RepID=A0A4R2I3F0_9ACTN|nr:putative intracellular protease/amidase [Kribbella antiqua]